MVLFQFGLVLITTSMRKVNKSGNFIEYDKWTNHQNHITEIFGVFFVKGSLMGVEVFLFNFFSDPVGIPLSVISTDYTNYAIVYGCQHNQLLKIKYGTYVDTDPLVHPTLL